MRRTFNYGGPLLAICLTLTGLSAAYADTTTTTVTTKTYEQPSFVQRNGSYVVVDPLTGVIRGDYIVGSRVVAGLPLSSNYVVMDKTSRRLVGTFDADGNLIDITNAPAASNVVVSIDSHRTALEKQIDAMLIAGSITTIQADRMRSDISRLFPATTTTRTVTYNSALEADSGLYSVEARLLPLSSKTYVSKTVSPRFVSINSQLVLPDNLTYRRMQLEQRMEDEFAFGRLNRDQLRQLKSDSTDIANKEANLRVDGLMNDANAAILAADLNVLQSKMEQYEANDSAGLQIGAKIIR